MTHHHYNRYDHDHVRAPGVPRIGIGGPVGSGKTALVDSLCKTMRDRY